ncbi:MAG: GTPase [Candidatus Cloacimonetes bacterium]|nr:GTPase [Candidatus Cloacimonadota bacterium]MBS3766852.1 GTPase [Candidatus Cloacimonadota bacterium]
MKKKVIIMGAAGRDFHNFNVYFRGNENYEVVAFTATQIPDIEGRKYPADLAGEELYPQGVPIEDEADLKNLIEENNIDQVVFAYSDVTNNYVMQKAAMVNDTGADFVLMGMQNSVVKTDKPLITICAVRTGCGKSQTTRRVVEELKNKGLKVASIRHPMPYGDLAKQKVQRFAEMEDLDKHKCTIEEMEEYEPHIKMGSIVYAGVDYEAIVREAEQEAEVIVWDGGNNDTPFYTSDNELNIVVADPHRPYDELDYYPGHTNLLRADIIVLNKIDSADAENIQIVRNNIRRFNPRAKVVDGASPVTVNKPELITNAKALVVEDGPTLTHGEMKYGAGIVAAEKYGVKELVDPRPYAVGTIKETFEKYPEIGTLLPAMGYGDKQVKDLEETINKADCEVVVIGTPIDLNRIIKIDKPTVRVKYFLQEIGSPDLKELIDDFIE